LLLLLLLLLLLFPFSAKNGSSWISLSSTLPSNNGAVD